MFLRPTHRWRPLLACLGFCLLSLLSLYAFPPQALAASDPITITSQTETVNFPRQIDFFLQANDSNNLITTATLFLKVDAGNAQEQHTITINPPSRTINVQWHENITGKNFLPVGTPVTYYWEVADSAKFVHPDALQNFSVDDTRFSWQHLSQGNLQVNWYNRPTDFGQAVLNVANADLQRINANLGTGPQHPIRLWIYQSVDDFHGALPPNTQEWVGGIAFPTFNQASIVVEGMDSDTLNRDMPHEMTHLVVHQLIANGAYAPTWFDEGLAVYNQTYKEPMMTLRMKQALKNHSLLRLQALSLDFPANADQAYLAYAQSWNLVDYMYSTFGQRKMATLIKDMNTTQGNFNDDLQQALGLDQPHLENQWRLYLDQSPILTPDQMKTRTSQPVHVSVPADNGASLLLVVGVLMIFLPLVGIGGLFAYQRRGRVRALATRQVQQSINTPLPSYYLPMHPHVPQTDPNRYQYPYAHPATQQSQPYPYFVPPPGTPMENRSASPFHLPREHSGGQTEISSPSFAPGQEYIGHYPEHQVPQE